MEVITVENNGVLERYIKLKKDMGAIKELNCLSYDLKDSVLEYYEREINAIKASYPDIEFD